MKSTEQKFQELLAFEADIEARRKALESDERKFGDGHYALEERIKKGESTGNRYLDYATAKEGLKGRAAMKAAKNLEAASLLIEHHLDQALLVFFRRGGFGFSGHLGRIAGPKMTLDTLPWQPELTGFRWIWREGGADVNEFISWSHEAKSDQLRCAAAWNKDAEEMFNRRYPGMDMEHKLPFLLFGNALTDRVLSTLMEHTLPPNRASQMMHFRKQVLALDFRMEDFPRLEDWRKRLLCDRLAQMQATRGLDDEGALVWAVIKLGAEDDPLVQEARKRCFGKRPVPKLAHEFHSITLREFPP